MTTGNPQGPKVIHRGVNILNIVFDFGRVVFTWESLDLVSHNVSDKTMVTRVHEAIFGHPDWAEVDRGAPVIG